MNQPTAHFSQSMSSHSFEPMSQTSTPNRCPQDPSRVQATKWPRAIRSKDPSVEGENGPRLEGLADQAEADHSNQSELRALRIRRS